MLLSASTFWICQGNGPLSDGRIHGVVDSIFEADTHGSIAYLT